MRELQDVSQVSEPPEAILDVDLGWHVPTCHHVPGSGTCPPGWRHYYLGRGPEWSQLARSLLLLWMPCAGVCDGSW